jgi:prepilin-type N-terminal cleavage/methylation domain-containing protein
MRRGFTLLELLIVIALTGVLSGLAFPRLAGALDGIHAGQAASRIALAHERARALALGEQRTALLRVTADSLTVLVNDSVRWGLAGPASDGATLSLGAAQTPYAPNGLALGAANTTFVVQRGLARVEVLVSRLGRVRIVRSAE